MRFFAVIPDVFLHFFQESVIHLFKILERDGVTLLKFLFIYTVRDLFSFSLRSSLLIFWNFSASRIFFSSAKIPIQAWAVSILSISLARLSLFRPAAGKNLDVNDRPFHARRAIQRRVLDL